MFQVEVVSKETVKQCNSSDWFDQRAGRITASKMKAVYRTNPLVPSVSLIKAICYPNAVRFKSRATNWGCEHEKRALDAYHKTVKNLHVNPTISETGLVIDIQLPIVGGSPDGLIDCECCGKGCIEIKCPVCQDTDVVPSCLTSDTLMLKHDHEYYYQVQTQMGVTQLQYTDFVVWREDQVVINRIKFDASFYSMITKQAKLFFVKCVCPELLGKWFSRNPLPGQRVMSTVNAVCYCRRTAADDNAMAHCSNPSCQIQNFHLECLRLKNKPKRLWYCPDCRKLMKSS